MVCLPAFFFFFFFVVSGQATMAKSRGGKRRRRSAKAATPTTASQKPFLVWAPAARDVVRKKLLKDANEPPKRGWEVPAEVSVVLCSGSLKLGGGSALSWTHAPELERLWLRPGFADEAVASLRNLRGERHTGSVRKARRDTLCFAFAHPESEELELVAIVNGYGKGDNIQHHRDDEPQIVVECPIATYSFGTSACFEVKTRRGVLVASIPTRTGLVVSMAGQRFQKDFSHGLPRKIESGYRLSVTLRTCEAAAGRTYDFSDMSLTPRREPFPAADGVDADDHDAGALRYLVASCVRHALAVENDGAEDAAPYVRARRAREE